MRKKIFAALVVAVGVAFAGYNMVQSQNEKNALSVLALANVEALAAGETLPDVEVTCGQSGGKCWTETSNFCYSGAYSGYDCARTSNTSNSCYACGRP